MSDFRQDPISGRWAIVAESRSARPTEYPVRPPSSSIENCPFCEGHESWTPAEVGADRPAGLPSNGPGWRVRAIPNKFPTLSADAGAARGATGNPEGPIRPGWGFHEVIIATPEHSTPLAKLTPEAAGRLLRMVRERLRVLLTTNGVEACVTFENSGPESGGTLLHPHLQIVALPEIPPLLREEVDGLARFARAHEGRCGYESIASAERVDRSRMVRDSDNFTVFAPFASEHPFEVRIHPRRHESSFAQATDRELDELASLLPAVLGALDAVAPGASYNLVSRALPAGRPRATEYHWHLDLLPRLVRADGFEVGGGISVNPVSPESAAEQFRAALERSGGPIPAAR